ncbi:MAG: SDR family NAD(P)-dependent oxidoreductase [Bacteroidia bacterium]
MNTFQFLLNRLLFPHRSLHFEALSKAIARKTILITGASFGIGEELAYTLAPTGATLLLVARTTEKLLLVQEKVKHLGGNAHIYTCDFTKREEVEGFIKELKDKEIDIVISNAGKSIRRKLADSLDRFHDFSRTMHINYLSPVQILLPLIPVLAKRKGHILHLSAVNVLLAPAPYWAAYQASKVAFDQWFRCTTPELNAIEISTTAVYLPLVKTRMIEPTVAYQNMPAMTTQQVANWVCNALITKPKRLAPWWLHLAEWASVILPSEKLLAFLYLSSK